MRFSGWSKAVMIPASVGMSPVGSAVSATRLNVDHPLSCCRIIEASTCSKDRGLPRLVSLLRASRATLCEQRFLKTEEWDHLYQGLRHKHYTRHPNSWLLPSV